MGCLMFIAIHVIPYIPNYAEQTVAMWRESKEKAIGQKEIHSFENHLYQRIGIGQRLLDKAKEQSSGAEENLPDILYEWRSNLTVL